MLDKIWASSLLVLALCLQVTAHAAVSPALGLQGAPTRADVKRPTGAQICGAGVDIASKFDSSTAATADASGLVSLTATCFNGGVDGSLAFKAQVDPTGTGKNFVPMDITQNGPNSPPKAESQTITAQLPPGIKCTGGSTGNKCLAQFVSKSGFGNCVAISQSAAAGTGNPTPATVAGDSPPTVTSTGRNPSTAAGGNRTPATDIPEAGENRTPAAEENPTTPKGCPAPVKKKKTSRAAVNVGAAAFAFPPSGGSLMARSLLAKEKLAGEANARRVGSENAE